jgi:hypothetical protein
MSVANFKTNIMITAEEFFRNKIKELHPNKEVVTLSQELITAEQGLRWAHEFKQLHLHAVSVSLPKYAEKGDYCAVCGNNEFWNDDEEE